MQTTHSWRRLPRSWITREKVSNHAPQCALVCGYVTSHGVVSTQPGHSARIKRYRFPPFDAEREGRDVAPRVVDCRNRRMPVTRNDRKAYRPWNVRLKDVQSEAWDPSANSATTIGITASFADGGGSRSKAFDRFTRERRCDRSSWNRAALCNNERKLLRARHPVAGPRA